MATITNALAYPFKRFDGIFNYLWVLIPIIGQFVFYGYYLRVLDSVIHNYKANHKGLPRFVKFGENLKFGFLFMLATLILLVILFLVEFILLLTGIGWIVNPILTLIIVVFALPLLPAQYAYSGKFMDAINIFKAFKTSFGHFGRYILLILKTLVVGFLYFAPVFLVCLIFLAAGMLPLVTGLQDPNILLKLIPNLLGLVVLFFVLIIPLMLLANALFVFAVAYLLGDFYRANRR